MTYEIFRLLHFAAIFAFAGALVIENMAIKASITSEDAHNLARVDAVCGISAALLLAFGVTLWVWVGKPMEFYSPNPLFQIKIVLFGLMVLSAVPTAVFFRRHRDSIEESIAVPKHIRLILKAQLILLLIIPLLAILMARGIGLNT